MLSQSNTETFPATARVWVYMADREFNSEESAEIAAAVKDFARDWAAHGHTLASSGEIVYDRFIVLTVNEDLHAASGCSIDSSVRFVRELENRYNVDFFNRMLVAYKGEGGEVETASMHQLSALREKGAINDDTIVFNNLVASKQELDTQWQIPLGESMYARLL